MSSETFVETLKHLGYPETDSLDLQGLEWIFEIETMVPFLEWFCEDVNSSNVLQPWEIREFEKLEASSEVILDDVELEEALQTLSVQDRDISKEELEDDIRQLSSQIELNKARKDKLIQQRNKLSLHHTNMDHRLSKMGQLENTAKHQHRKQLNAIQIENTQMNSRLRELNTAVENLTDFYHQSSSPTAGHLQVNRSQKAAFLSQMPLDDYQKTEKEFSQKLTSFTKKQFFEGISDIAGCNDAQSYGFLDIHQPQTFLLTGEPKEVKEAYCRELRRLQSAHHVGETKRVEAMVESHKMATCVEVAKKKCLQLESKSYVMSNVENLSAIVEETSKVLSSLNIEISNISDNTLPSLLERAACLQFSNILQGDYDLKLIRQDYFTHNQDKVIHELIQQRARNQFLTLAFEVEGRGHREVNRLLNAVSAEVKKKLTAFRSRMKAMQDPHFSTKKHKRETIDSRNKALMRLHNVLEVEQNPLDKKHNLFLTHTSLVEEAKRLSSSYSNANMSLSSVKQSQGANLTSLEKMASSWEGLVFLGSHPADSLLSPQPVVDGIFQLENLLKRLKQSVIEIQKDTDHKKKILRYDRRQANHRQLFVNFFLHPEKLETGYKKLQDQLKLQ